MTAFVHLVRAEWTKLRSVRRWSLALVGAMLLTVLLSLLVAAGSVIDVNKYPNFVTGPDGRPVVDEFHFGSQRLTGDGSITAHIGSQENSGEWALAGLMMKAGTTSGARYASIALTPGHGVRMQANFSTDIGSAAAPWLRLTRAGTKVTGSTSADGVTWQQVAVLDNVQLPATVEIGLFVSSPPKVIFQRSAGSTSVGMSGTIGSATFDKVQVDGTPAQLVGVDVRHPRVEPPAEEAPPPGREGDKEGGEKRGEGGTVESNGVYTVTGAGEIGDDPIDDDVIQVSLFGIFAAVITLIAIGALFMTSEFKRDMLRTTFTASPRRGQVLAAKAIVLGSVAFGIGLAASIAALYAAQPLLRKNGWGPPAFAAPSLTDGPVLRAVLLTSVFVAAIALLSLGVAAIVRHSAAAITGVIVVVVLPFILGGALPIVPAKWLLLVTPSGGFAALRAKPPTTMLADPSTMISPWLGVGVACLYAVVALTGAGWLLRRRDA